MSFTTNSTRQLKQGDTPDLNDGLVSRRMTDENIPRGTACVMIAGFVTIANSGNEIQNSPFVPTEQKDNSTGSPGDLEIKGVTPGQKVALLKSSTPSETFPGDFVEISGVNPGTVQNWNRTTNDRRYAYYIGKKGAILETNLSTPFEQTLSSGIIPDESLFENEVGWFRLVDASVG